MGTLRPATNSNRFPLGAVIATWGIAYIAALPLQGVLLAVTGHGGDDSSTLPISVTMLSILCLWAPFLVGLIVMSRAWGTGNFGDDFKCRMRFVDFIGLPIGIICQLVLIPALYVPLRAWWPETFSTVKVEERARELWDKADGAWIIVLVVVVVLGAPIVEELVYRGLILQALQNRLNNGVAIVLSAVLFAAIHLQPIELPGLFIFAVVLGICFQRTGRLSMSIMAHMAFNAVGLVLASR